MLLDLFVLTGIVLDQPCLSFDCLLSLNVLLFSSERNHRDLIMTTEDRRLAD